VQFTIGMTVRGPTASAIATAEGGSADAGLTLLTSEPGPGYVLDALRSAYYSVSRLALAVIPPEFELQLRERIQATHALVVQLPNGAAAGRNDPCPCRSGRKFKPCHGA
jgi:hypothetical protein